MRDAASPAVLTIDGPAGAGKSTLADTLVRAHPDWQLVRLDDIYPGWAGLQSAIDQVAHNLVAPILTGQDGHWLAWDWHACTVRAEHSVRAGARLIIEGCGATLTIPDADTPGTRQLWVETSDADRARRLQLRDGNRFDDHWPLWTANWQTYVETSAPLRRCELVRG